jgi:allophanate hydrolase subunit 2
VLPEGLIPEYSDNPVLRVVPGPQDDCISPRGIETFFSAEFEVSGRSDRMGSVLSGPAIEHGRGRGDIISDGTIPGAVQAPGNGQPIILGNDCQTTGGYAKIATVIAADLPLAGQLYPGLKVRFQRVSFDQARAAFLKNEYLFRSFMQISTT